MTLSMPQKLLAGAVLAGAASAGWWLSAPTEELSAPMPVRPRATPLVVTTTAPLTGQNPRAQAWPAPSAEALRAWGGDSPRPVPAVHPAPAAPTVVAVAAASAPARAPVPAWRFVGRITDGAAVRAMLVTPQQLRVVAEQEALDAEWRVERIGEQGVELLWLPGDQRVRLAWATS